VDQCHSIRAYSNAMVADRSVRPVSLVLYRVLASKKYSAQPEPSIALADRYSLLRRCVAGSSACALPPFGCDLEVVSRKRIAKVGPNAWCSSSFAGGRRATWSRRQSYFGTSLAEPLACLTFQPVCGFVTSNRPFSPSGRASALGGQGRWLDGAIQRLWQAPSAHAEDGVIPHALASSRRKLGSIARIGWMCQRPH
jgi:hypothetical protein